MNGEMIKRWNNKVKEEDVIYHVGDFAFKKTSADFFEKKLNGKIIHILGNHDKNNGVKSYITHAIMKFGGLIIFVKHKPPDEFQERTIEETLMSACDFIICGHVHNLWKTKKIKGKIAVNVGVDVWGFEPITIFSILKCLKRVERGL